MSERVVVAMSGGVDSSVAAALLVEQGYDVIGVMLRLWAEPVPPTLGGAVEAATNRCCSVEAIHDARGVADRLDIPFYVINVEQPFKRDVVDFFVAGYASAQTPNPCLMCNRKIRFGYLLDYARSLGAAYLATGHYAQARRDDAGNYQLWRGTDPVKDQSYVLSVLGQADLAAALFPVGGYTKPQVRALAAARGLPTASRVDSQDLCFVADGDYRRFLAEHAPDAVRPGPILDRVGRQLGMHRGLPFYTIGQRSGLGIAASEPLYVLEKDATANVLIVGGKGELGQLRLRMERVNWIAGAAPAAPFVAAVQIRYHSQAAPAAITLLPDGAPDGGPNGGAEVVFAAAQRDITPGQAAVIYDGNRCLGGGIIIHAT
jgi:tRNA-uridine 2-sulfurtransferase